MVTGVNPNSVYPSRSDSSALRERSDIARNSAVSGLNGTPQGIREDLAAPRAEVGGRQTSLIDTAAIERRIEARQASEDLRLERFRADDVPLANARALAAFTGVASFRENVDVELAGIDIVV
ncbi:UDP pyrophosphate phosphatase [Marinobacter changyiensis]|uniref:UDP pyrophosphate phosphatase n=1 Tax=Marinobacter changyiensis TaxID=2604091 RepID=UPI0012643C3C|nr:UDP pyrophosphate phosphatase [Marinobacter changyiensis]